ncbi:MAG: SDR family oxidoreductase [Nitrospinota bacterium]|nr:SDR family oxidoreductase [Nitrospinota bacterium]
MAETYQSKKLFCFGLGFSGSALAGEARRKGWNISGTFREYPPADAWIKAGIQSHGFNGKSRSPEVENAVREASHVLVTIPPQKVEGEVVLRYFEKIITDSPCLQWLGYLSTTGVYGNRNGEWVDETSELKPEFDHQHRRAQAEADWLNLYLSQRVPVHIFRLGGIYGPGRNLLDRVRKKVARRIDRPGLVFNRIHVEDVIQTLMASMERPNPGEVYNVVDDLPSDPSEAVRFACELLKAEVPPLISLEDAGLSAMARGFYLTNKRVRNEKIKQSLGIKFRYPDYKAGLISLLENERKM